MVSANEFAEYARECVRLAALRDVNPQMRDQLLEMAREWMKAAMDTQADKPVPSKPPVQSAL